MNYNFDLKLLDDSIELTRLEWEVLEELINAKGKPLSAKKICDIIYEKYYVTGVNPQKSSEDSIRVAVCRLRNKTKGEIKCRNMLGYYIKEEENKNEKI